MLNPNLLPDFIVIGAGRSGTTSLYYYLRQHPDIFMSPIKEANYFAYDPDRMDQFSNIDESSFPVKDLASYQSLFSKRKKTSAAGEVSPRYLWHPSAPKKIYNLLPGVKLIAVLRNPVDRAYSAYYHYVSIGMEKRSFAQAIAEEAGQTKNAKWPLGRGIYIGTSFYYRQCVRYMDYFPRQQMKVYLYDDLLHVPLEVMRGIYNYIGVRENYLPDINMRYNASGLSKNRMIHYILRPRQLTKRLRRYLPRAIHDPIFNVLMKIKDQNLVKPSMDMKLRKQLIGMYHDDIIKLGNLINRDLSHWLER